MLLLEETETRSEKLRKRWIQNVDEDMTDMSDGRWQEKDCEVSETPSRAVLTRKQERGKLLLS